MKYGEEVIGRRIGIPCVVSNAEEEAGGNNKDGSGGGSSNLKYSLRKGVIRRMRVTFEIEFENGFVDCMDLEEEEGRQQLMWIQDKDNRDVSVKDEVAKDQEHGYVMIPNATKSDCSLSPSSSSSSSVERETPGAFAAVKTAKVEHESSTNRVAPTEAHNTIPRGFGNNEEKESKKRLFPSQANHTRDPIGTERQESAHQTDERRQPELRNDIAASIAQPQKAANRVDNRPRKRQTTEAHEATLLNARNLVLQHADNKNDACDQQAASSYSSNSGHLLNGRKERTDKPSGSVSPSESPVMLRASKKAAETSPTIDSLSSLEQASSNPFRVSPKSIGMATLKHLPKKKQIATDKEKHHPCPILNATEDAPVYYKKNPGQDESGKAVAGKSLHATGSATSHHASIQATAESSDSDVPLSSGLASNRQNIKTMKPPPKKKQILPLPGGSSVRHSTTASLKVAFLNKSVPRKAATQLPPSKPLISSSTASLAKPNPRKKQMMPPASVSRSNNSVSTLREKPGPRKKQLLCPKDSINPSIASPLAGASVQDDAGKHQTSTDSNDRTTLQAEAGKKAAVSYQRKVADRVGRITPGRESQDSIAWVENFHKWLLNTAHGRNHETVSDENANRIIAKVKLLATGKGISYVRWRKGVVFYKGKKVDLTSNFDRMLQEAKRFEDKHGEDVGHGWVLRHPITKLGLYKRHLQSRRCSLRS